MQTVLQDVRYGVRLLLKSPGFAAVAVLTLALGVGANTAIFSAVNGLLLRPLPYVDPSRLASIMGFRQFSGGIVGSTDFSPDVWKQLQAQTPSIERIALYQNRNLTLTGEVIPEIVPGAKVSADFFSVLGARPLLGRPILPADTLPGAKPVVVLSYALWQSVWGGDKGVVGRQVMLDGTSYAVVGVMPEGFEFPLYSGPKGVWLPLLAAATEHGNEGRTAGLALARLKPGISVDVFNAQLKTVSTRLSASFTGFLEGGYFLASRVKPDIADLDSAFLILFAAVGFVLLIACVNLSGLSLARGFARQREVAIREALGAARGRIVRQFLTESVLLALVGGALGLLFSLWGVRVLRAITPASLPEHGHFRLDANVLWFTLAVSVLAGILFGLAPALQASARRIGPALKEQLGGSPGASSGKRARRFQNVLVTVEIALAVILVSGATLAARSFGKLAAVNLGFRTEHVLTAKANFSKSLCGSEDRLPACKLAASDALSKIRDLPGVQDAAVSSTVPLLNWQIASSLRIQGSSEQISLGTGAFIQKRAVSPGYFGIFGISLLSGRGFDKRDTAASPAVVIVDQAFAAKYLGTHPLGSRISERQDKRGNPQWLEVVGVVSDARDFNPEASAATEIYTPFAQTDRFWGATYAVRSTANPLVLAPAIKRAIWSVDKNAPITDLQTMDQIVHEVIAEPRFQTLLLGAFGALGLLMAAIGIYGVISYAVEQRTREIGVRMALGARQSDILGMVMRQGLLLAAIGTSAGLAGALALTRFMRSLLFEVSPTDPPTFAAVAATLVFVSLVACYVPARRATCVDPLIALRYD